MTVEDGRGLRERERRGRSAGKDEREQRDRLLDAADGPAAQGDDDHRRDDDPQRNQDSREEGGNDRNERRKEDDADGENHERFARPESLHGWLVGIVDRFSVLGSRSVPGSRFGPGSRFATPAHFVLGAVVRDALVFRVRVTLLWLLSQKMAAKRRHPQRHESCLNTDAREHSHAGLHRQSRDCRPDGDARHRFQRRPRTRPLRSTWTPTPTGVPISPGIYGVAHATTAQLIDLRSPLNRNGGNNTTRYNWQLNADNRGNDWYYQSIADGSATPGGRGDSFVAATRAANATPMLTVPTIDWIAKVGANRSKLASFSIAKYGAQTGNDWQWYPDAGNGVRTSGQFVTGNDPNDANVPSNSTFQQGWVQHLVNRWGTNANGGVPYYILDNEPSIWHSTHRDVHPTGATMEEVRNKILDYADQDQGGRSDGAGRRP